MHEQNENINKLLKRTKQILELKTMIIEKFTRTVQEET